MITLGGSVGTGIFLTSGYSVFIAGPGGAVCAYIIMAVVVYFLMASLREMTVFSPSSGSFCDYSNRYVSSSFGFAIGYNYWLSWTITIATEISAAVIVLGYWLPDINATLLSISIFLILFAINLLSVRLYGEVEYWLSFLKIAVIITFIILGLWYYITHIDHTYIASNHLPTLHHQIHNSNNVFINLNKESIFHHGWLGIISVFLFAGFSFQGIELVGVASGEAKHPEKNIPRAIKIVFWRLAIFYVLSILVIALSIKYNDPRLASQNNVNISPYTLIFSNYMGIYAAHFVNLIIFIALVSTANASMYTATRILWYLSKARHSHPIITTLNKHSIPVNALLISAICGLVFFALSLVHNGQIFTFLVSTSSLSGFLAWFGISLSHYRFRKYYIKEQGTDKQLKYKANLFPVAPLMCMAVISFIIVAQFISLHSTYNWQDFMLLYSSVVLFAVMYTGHKIYTWQQNRHNTKP